jgi:hypothetical protein
VAIAKIPECHRSSPHRHRSKSLFGGETHIAWPIFVELGLLR